MIKSKKKNILQVTIVVVIALFINSFGNIVNADTVSNLEAKTSTPTITATGSTATETATTTEKATGTINENSITLTGYLIDEHCFVKKSADPGKDTKHCLLMTNCIKGGYGIAVPQSDGSYKFYYFDGNFFTDITTLNGTGGQKLAYDIATATTKADHVSVTITGNTTVETKPSINLIGVSYPVIKLTSIKETEILTGTVSTGTISTGTVSTGTISTGTISTGTVSTGTISTGTISTGTISTGTISTSTISTKETASTSEPSTGDTNSLLAITIILISGLGIGFAKSRKIYR